MRKWTKKEEIGIFDFLKEENKILTLLIRLKVLFGATRREL